METLYIYNSLIKDDITKGLTVVGTGSIDEFGNVGEIEFAPEYKLEFQCKEEDLKQAVNAIKENHPYEEVCINIIPLVEL